MALVFHEVEVVIRQLDSVDRRGICPTPVKKLATVFFHHTCVKDFNSYVLVLLKCQLQGLELSDKKFKQIVSFPFSELTLSSATFCA